MSRPYNGRPPGEPGPVPGSIRRARERALMGMQREMQALDPSNRTQELSRPPYSNPPPPPQSPTAGGYTRSPRSRPPGTTDARSKGSKPISRPTQMAQWPLPAAASPSAQITDFPSNQLHSPPSQGPPQRPPRPSQSRIPSMLDQSRPQQPTPVFTSRQQAVEDVHVAPHGTPTAIYEEDEARRSTSSLESIPDYPIAQQATYAKRTTMGPPPSSRRGASSLYSRRSFVSPIQEETPRSRSYRSFASSAAMPESWPEGTSRYDSQNHRDTYLEEPSDEYGDESQLVRSASLGKRAKPALVMSKPSGGNTASQTRQITTKPREADTQPSETAIGSQIPEVTGNGDAVDTVSSGSILKAYSAASAPNLQSNQPSEASRRSFRTSALRRPPRLDIDAVRAAEARGSLTSLPDLILRATRLAAMMDKGRRPTSRLNTLEEYLNEKGSPMDSDRETSDDARVSGLSGMLSAFPPPVPNTPRDYRNSIMRNSTWPRGPDQGLPTLSTTYNEQNTQGKPKRRCCGMPIWLFILVTVIFLCLIVAAVVIPLEFFVFKNLGNQNKPRDTSAAAQCKGVLNCKNGGTSIILQGNCSCICSNGFNGADCSFADSLGCTSTNLVSSDKATRISNVTLGVAIPRLVVGGSANFSVPLSGTEVAAAFNQGNLSCLAQNALVTFNGRSTNSGTAALDAGKKANGDQISAANEAYPVITVITFTPVTVTTTITIPKNDYPQMPTETSSLSRASSAVSNSPGPTETIPFTSSSVTSTSSTRTTDIPPKESAFLVNDQTLDFARVGMLLILQQKGLGSASAAQQALQQFFTRAAQSATEVGKPVTMAEASSVDLNGGITINLVDFTINIGGGPVGRKSGQKRDIFGKHLRKRTVN